MMPARIFEYLNIAYVAYLLHFLTIFSIFVKKAEKVGQTSNC